MSANRFGQLLQMVSFGESHGPELGAVLDGVPAGVIWDQGLLERSMARRRPGRLEDSGDLLVSARSETDEVEVLSGVWDGKTLGTPIAMVVRNHDTRSEDYAAIKPGDRRGHADDMWAKKFGHSDPRGGGRASGRETVARVMAGAVAEMFLRQALPGIRCSAWLDAIGPIQLGEGDQVEAANLSSSDIDRFPARFPSPTQTQAVRDLLANAKANGESYGARICLQLTGLPTGLGQPVFHKFKADMAAALMGVGAVSSVELGEPGPQSGTQFHSGSSRVYGGVRGGITTGEPLVMRIGVKPTSSILDVAKKGRHDPCIGVRAIPVIEAMAWMVTADHVLWTRLDRIV